MAEHLSSDTLISEAVAAAMPIVEIQAWAERRWNALVHLDLHDAMTRDAVMLPAYKANLKTMDGVLTRAAAAGYDPEKISVARSMLERADLQLRRMSNMVQVGLADAQRAGELDRDYRAGVAGITFGDVVVVGLSTAAIVALFIAAPVWVAASALLIASIVAARTLVEAAANFLARLSVPAVGQAVVSTVHSFTWIAGLAVAGLGLWMFGRRPRRVSS